MGAVMKYRCRVCNYRFTPKGRMQPTRCPYCAGTNTMMAEK